ncbi:MAG TPA: hypothetical protein VJP45_03500 [Candidatus Limnocylindria bacterium]|nr:hypothetical protein [Candidatus Limnocylindria bacterium]
MRRAALALAGVLLLPLGVPRPASAATTPPTAALPSATTAAPCGTPGVPTTTIFLPNITKMLGGPNGWVTPFIVQNVGTKKASLEVSFYRFTDGALVTCRRIDDLAPGTSFADFPNNDEDLPADAQFAVVVKSFGSEVVSVVNEHQALMTPQRAEALSYNGLTTGATTVYLPFIAKPEPGPCTAVPQTEVTCNARWLTTFVMQNFGATNAIVTARFTSYDGGSTATLSRAIAPGRSRFIDPSVEPELRAGRYFSVVLTSTQPIGVIVNAHDDAPTTTAPRGFSYNGIAQPTFGDAFLPYVRRVGVAARTYGSGVLVQNAGAGNVTPTLTFHRLGGGSQVSFNAPAPIKPGATWYFDPETQPLLAVGEYSLVASGGALAVLDATLTEGTAMGYIAMSGQGNRAYLPNVTRTLGGPQGWTTPIVLQSTGATSATLRWYRFSDGALVTRQTVGPLTRGAAIRVDPRSIAALADHTQYGVVVDAKGGNLAAVVTELNFEGGDGMMIYEGFPATVDPVPAPTALTVTPSSLRIGTDESVPLVATVKDQFDEAMPQYAPTWRVVPEGLGTVSLLSRFTAAASGGIGTITATAGPVSETIPVAVVAPTPATVGGLSFLVRTTGAADVYAETTVTRSDAAAINIQIDADVRRVEQDYARSFAGRPQVYVLGTDASYRTAQTAILGIPPIFVSAPDAPSEFESAGVYYAGKVAMHWGRSRDTKPLTVGRHELTHMIIDEITGDDSLVPAWLNEGSARREEFSIAGSEWWRIVNRYRALSMAANSRLFTTDELSSQASWNDREGLASVYQYAEAQQIVQLLYDELGGLGVHEILRLIGTGLTFEEAYQLQPRRIASSFGASVAGRLQSQARSAGTVPSPAPPGIDFAPDSSEGTGANGPTFILWGFAPSSTVTLSISGAATGFTNANRLQTVDEYGVYWNRLGTSWPPDTYTFTVTTNTGQTVTRTVTKAQ